MPHRIWTACPSAEESRSNLGELRRDEWPGADIGGCLAGGGSFWCYCAPLPPPTNSLEDQVCLCTFYVHKQRRPALARAVLLLAATVRRARAPRRCKLWALLGRWRAGAPYTPPCTQGRLLQRQILVAYQQSELESRSFLLLVGIHMMFVMCGCDGGHWRAA